LHEPVLKGLGFSRAVKDRINRGLYRLRKNPLGEGFVSGHDFSRAAKDRINRGLYRLRKNPLGEGFVSGHDFSRADKADRMNRALAPEGRS
jgi:hypothetical protein